MRLPKICGGFINLTQKCNLNCRYCFVHQQPLEMDFKTAKDAVIFYAENALSELVTPQVTFFGGEPMLKYKSIIKPLVEFIRETYGDFIINITTNGTLNTKEVYEFFQANDVGMLLSLDGMEEIQNLNRPYHSGDGSFNSINIPLYLSYYPYGTFRATINNNIVSKVYKNYLWGEKQGFKSCAFILNTFADWSDKEIEIYKSELNKIANHIKERIEEKKPYMRFSEIDKMAQQYRELQNADEGYFRDANQDCAACGRCGLGGGQFGSIGASGDVYSCQEMTENPDTEYFKIGNIYDGIDDIKRLEIANGFNTRNVKSEVVNRCESCKLNRVCDGACTINNYFKFGDVHILTKVQCEVLEHYLKLYEDIYGGVE